MLTDVFTQRPRLRTTGKMIRQSTDSAPSQHDEGHALPIGTELLREDTGKLDYWTGSEWVPVALSQKIVQQCELLTEIRDLLKGKLQ